MAFIYPQQHISYRKGPWDPKAHLTSIGQVKKLTGIDVFPDVPEGDLSETKVSDVLWPVDKNDFDKSCRRFAPKVH